MSLYGRLPEYRVFALAADDAAGALLGVGGYASHPEGAMAFLDLAPDVEPKRHKRTLTLAAKRSLAAARATKEPVFVLRDKTKPSSQSLLRHFGFRPDETATTADIWTLKPAGAGY